MTVGAMVGRSFVAALVAAALGACAPASGTLPPSPPLVEVTLSEYDFAYDAPVPSGRVVFEVTNAGGTDHELALVPLPDDLPPLDEQLRSDKRQALGTLANSSVLEPGASRRFAVDLAPGRYGMLCFVTDADGTPHALKGMTSEFRVR